MERKKHSDDKQKTVPNTSFDNKTEHRYFIIAGEASGDLHAANLMKELKKMDEKANFCFLGGDLMLAQGGTMVRHYRDMAFMGFITVIKNWRKVLSNFKATQDAIEKFQPDVVILVDYPSFNLRIAKFVKKRFKIPVYYYISPKIWAWKEFRIKNIKKYVDKMFTILPFETEFYRKHNFKVHYVGNPSVDAIANRSNKLHTFHEFCEIHQFPKKPIIALLPGSRKQEVTACLPKMIEAAQTFSDYQVVISGAPGVEKEFFAQFFQSGTLPVLFNQTYELVSHSKAAVVNSGTAVLEVALLDTPQVVVYNVPLGKCGMFLKDVLIKVPFVTLVNLVARKEIVKELLAHQFNTENLLFELKRLLYDKSYMVEMKMGYQTIKERLGNPGAAKRAATAIFSSLKKDDFIEN